MLLKSRASRTCFLACCLPGRAKASSAPGTYIIIIITIIIIIIIIIIILIIIILIIVVAVLQITDLP